MATLKQLVDSTTSIKNDIVTCHTKLKEKLVGAGIEVVPQDKLVTLVDKVKIGGGLGIKVLTGAELPLEVTNNAIFLKDIDTLGNVYILENKPEMDENDIFIQSNLCDSTKGVELIIGDDKINSKLYVSLTQQKRNGEYHVVDAWAGVNGVWEKISSIEYIVYSSEDKEFKLGSNSASNWDYFSANITSTTIWRFTANDNEITVKGGQAVVKEEAFRRNYLKETLDISPFNKIYFQIKETYKPGAGTTNFALGLAPQGNVEQVAVASLHRENVRSPRIIGLDISQLTGHHHIFIKVGIESVPVETSYPTITVYVDKIYLTS